MILRDGYRQTDLSTSFDAPRLVSKINGQCQSEPPFRPFLDPHPL